jgi:carbamate kinase
VYEAFGTPGQRLLGHLTAGEAEALLVKSDLGRGSMAPKVEAAVAFVRGGGRRAHIGRLEQGLDVVNGNAGTTIVNS